MKIVPDLYMITAVVIAFIIKGMCGFANTLVFTTILSFRQANINISPVEIIAGYPSNIYIAWREREKISAKIWVPLSLLVMMGSIPGAFLLKNVDTSILKIIFGMVVIAISFEMILREHNKKQSKTNQILLGAIGLLSGLLCGLFGVGALLAAYVSRTTDNTPAFRGNICAVFIVENTFRILLYIATGIITWQTFQSALLLLPFMLIGLMGGTFLGKILDDTIVKKIVMLLLLLSGISLIVTNIMH